MHALVKIHLAPGADCTLSGHDGVTVVHDEQIKGGTRRRVAYAALKEITDKNHSPEIVYACQPEDITALAIAHACFDLNLKFTLFTPEHGSFHDYTRAAVNLGAELVWVPPGAAPYAIARHYSANGKSLMLPRGLDAPRFEQKFLDCIQSVADHVSYPDAVWCADDCGILSRALQTVWPAAMQFTVVCSKDAFAHSGIATRLMAREASHEKAEVRPPFVSNPYLDAKAWRYVREYRTNGKTIFWNSAG